jgi:hypothetical protein
MVSMQCNMEFEYQLSICSFKCKSTPYVCPYLTEKILVLHHCYEPNMSMLSIGSWRWYINITIIILDIINSSAFYLNLNSTLHVCPYLTKNILHFCFEPNMLILSIGLWRWYINITITILNIIHRPAFYLILNWTLNVSPYLTGNTLRLLYEPNWWMPAIGLWR